MARRELTPEALKQDAGVVLAFLQALEAALPGTVDAELTALLESVTRTPAVLALLHQRLAGK